MFNRRHTTLVALATVTLLTGCATPTTCDTNHSFQETRIEIRNYETGYFQGDYGMRPCLNPDGSMNMCPYDDTIWVQGHFEWREQGKYDNPNEGWVTENNDPKETNTGYSYKKTMGWDKITCNNEQDNGKIVEHAHRDEFYIQK